MDEKLLRSILTRLQEETTAKQSNFVKFSDPRYTSVMFSKKNFHSIDAAPDQRIAFIDGGNGEIIRTSNMSLQFIRIFGNIYHQNQRVDYLKKEFFVLVHAVNEGTDVLYRAEVFGEDIHFDDLNIYDETLSEGSHKVDVSAIGETCRKFAELHFAAELIEQLEDGDILVRDGDLQVTITGEDVYFKKLHSAAKKQGVIVCGLSKTCSLLTDAGDNALFAIRKMTDNEQWYYHPLVRIQSDDHPADIIVVKLHNKGKYVFRLDIHERHKDQISMVTGLLALNSKDPSFLGYPYGLIDADRFARVKNNEVNYLKALIMARSGSKWKNLAQSITSLDAHSLLDNM